MLNLAEYRKHPASLADFLPWAALVAEGVVLNKDGSFQRTASFRGPDLDSATPAELVGGDGAAQQRAPPSRLRLGDLCRSAADRGQDLSAQQLSGCSVGAGRSRTAGRFRGGGRPFREPLFPDLRLAAAGRGRLARSRASSTKAARRPASIRGSCCADSSIGPTASFSSSKASCPRSVGSMTARR